MVDLVTSTSPTLDMYLYPMHLKNQFQLPLCPYLLLGEAPEAICPGSWLCTPSAWGSPV